MKRILLIEDSLTSARSIVHAMRAMPSDERSTKGLSYDVESIVDELWRVRDEIERTKEEYDRRVETREGYE